jgi:predicted permease
VGLGRVVPSFTLPYFRVLRPARRARAVRFRAPRGAGPRALVAMLIVESLLLSLAAAGLSLLVAVWGIGVARAWLPEGIARTAGIALDMRVFAAALAGAVLTGLFFGAVPALQASRIDLATVLKEGVATVTGVRQRWRTAFLVAEVAFVSVLMVATTLFVSSFIQIVRADLGFDRTNLVAIEFSRRPAADPEALLQALRSTPGVASVAAFSSGRAPLLAGSASTTVQAPGAPPGAEPVQVEFRRVSGAYFDVAGIPVIRGRVFDGATDTAGGPVVIIDETLAAQVFGDRDPIGAAIDVRGEPSTVIGVVRNVRLGGPERTSGPQLYATTDTWRGAHYLVRTGRPADQVVAGIRHSLAPAVEERYVNVRLLESVFRDLTADRRFNATLMSIFGALALFIGAAGVYGVMASMVAQRTKEIGVRVALGATAGRVTREVLGQTGRYLLVGLVIGLPIAMATSRMFAALLYEVQPTDAFVYVVVSAILLVVGLAAALIPARRAARVDPGHAMRI